MASEKRIASFGQQTYPDLRSPYRRTGEKRTGETPYNVRKVRFKVVPSSSTNSIKGLGNAEIKEYEREEIKLLETSIIGAKTTSPSISGSSYLANYVAKTIVGGLSDRINRVMLNDDFELRFKRTQELLHLSEDSGLSDRLENETKKVVKEIASDISEVEQRLKNLRNSMLAYQKLNSLILDEKRISLVIEDEVLQKIQLRPLTVQVIARALNISVEDASNAVRKLFNEGLIDKFDGKILPKIFPFIGSKYRRESEFSDTDTYFVLTLKGYFKLNSPIEIR